MNLAENEKTAKRIRREFVKRYGKVFKRFGEDFHGADVSLVGLTVHDNIAGEENDFCLVVLFKKGKFPKRGLCLPKKYKGLRICIGEFGGAIEIGGT